MRVLSQGELGRATLARQMLLARSDREPLDAVEHLLGLQAQAPLPPYYGLWCRLQTFDPQHLAQLIIDRSVVRVALMRSTVHLVSAADARRLRPLIQPALHRMFRGTTSGRALAAGGVDMADLASAGRDALADRPLTGKELGERLRQRWPAMTGFVLADGVRTAVPLVQVPPRGIWGAGGLPRLAVLDDWAPEPTTTGGGGEDPVPSIERMIARYLGAFGPATVADVQAWCGLTRLSEVVERMRADLACFRSESGAELFDLPDAPRPAADTPAPVRLIAEFDNLALSHADRTRVIADADRRRAASRNGIVPGLVLVDGVGRATWRLMSGPTVATLQVGELQPLNTAQRTQVEAEAYRMLAFAVPGVAHDVAFGALP